ncbi:hypothetical protein GEMRC1_010031 [Eukaryota sp. GEM-RC1]
MSSETNNLLGKPSSPGFFSTLGWASFSLVWNLCNSIIYATLFPKLLEDITDKWEEIYSAASGTTTLIASIMLPVLGVLADQTKSIKTYLVIASVLATLINLLLPFLSIFPSSYVIPVAQSLYILGMGLLRLAVMCNNALLACFPVSKRVSLSLISNFVGFTCALFGFTWFALEKIFKNCQDLKYLSFLCRTANANPSTLTLYVLIFTSSLLPLLLLTPSEKSSEVKKNDVSLKSVFKGFLSAFKSLFFEVKNTMLKKFLITYLFYSTAGTVWSIFLPSFIKSMYKPDLSTVSLVMLWFMTAFVIGVLIGLLIGKLTSSSLMKDFKFLLFQNFCFFIAFCAIILFSYKFKSSPNSLFYVQITSSVIGLLYSWNASLSRAVMSKLSPTDDVAFYMGLFSTATYLGIGVCSYLVSFLKKIGFSMVILPCLLVFTTFIGQFLLFNCIRIQKKSSFLLN